MAGSAHHVCHIMGAHWQLDSGAVHIRLCDVNMWADTVTFKTVAISNLDVVHKAHHKYLWKFHFALVETNKVQTLGYELVLGSCDFGQVAMEIWPFQISNTIAIVLHSLILRGYLVLCIASFGLDYCLNPPRHALNQLMTLLSWYLLPFLLNPFLQLMNPIRRVFILCQPPLEITPAMFNGAKVRRLCRPYHSPKILLL